MSDADVLRVIEEMDVLLQSELPDLGPQVLEDWQLRLEAALATAERGTAWPRIVEHAHATAQRVFGAVGELGRLKDEVKRELDQQVVGSRALKAYQHQG